jgi:hypothetical protein
MHGIVSASILIAVFAVIALAGLYVAVRIHLAGSTRRKARPRPAEAHPGDERPVDERVAAEQEGS